MKRTLVLFLLAGMAFAQQPPAPLPSQPRPLTVAAIFAAGGLTGRAPENLRWSPDGRKVSFIQRDASGERGQLWYVDVATGNKAVLVSAEKLSTLAPPYSKLSEREHERRTRYGVAEYLWAPDSQHILFDSFGQLWLYRLDTGTATQITSSPDPIHAPHFSPDGKRLAYIRKHNLWVSDVGSAGLHQLTNDTDENLLNGEVDWVYAEELDVRNNYFWSPDSRHILFLQMDETRVPTYPIPDLIPTQPSVDMQKYPKAGDPNPGVRLGVVGATGGKVKWLKVPPAGAQAETLGIPEAQEFYIARFGWVRAGLAWAQVLNRAQDKLDLYFVDVHSGQARRILSETSPDWVEVNDDFTFIGENQFLWSSWRDGHTHLYLYSYDSANPLAAEARLERQLTRGDFEVFEVSTVDQASGTVYFLTNAGDDRQRQLFRVKLDGSGFARVSSDEGTHEATFGKSPQQYVDKFSALTTPPRLSLCRVDGPCQAFWESASLAAYQLIPPRFVDFRAADGTLLHGLLLMPPDIPAGSKVPLLMNPYGGPGSQFVRNVWGASRSLFHQVLAREGIAVLSVDNRGMAGRGRAFAAALRRKFGEVELQDQLAALQQALAAYPVLDSQRVGFWGWSYGGTMTLWALTRSTAFRAGVSVAPVTDWRDYDSIYTERYMALPQENAEGYRRSSPVTTAAGLHGSLLLVHGTGDDNVHFQNTVQMTEAFIRAGQRFELMIYPRKTHAISGPVAQTDLFTRIQRHFERELLGRSPHQPLQ